MHDIWQLSIVSELKKKFTTLKSDLFDSFCEINIWYWQMIIEFKANSVVTVSLRTNHQVEVWFFNNAFT